MEFRFFLSIATAVLLFGCSSSEAPVDTTQDTSSEDSEATETLPDISNFQINPSDQFLVDIAAISDGQPHKGMNAVSPHGAHVHFNDADPQWDNSNLSALDYPAIYAVADGFIFSVSDWTQVGSNYRYGIDLAFATRDGKTILFQYSIEPMTNPGDSTFYQDFILVNENQQITKGEILAYMYIPFGENQGTHIHFGLNDEDYSQEIAPAIFLQSIVQDFYETWSTFKKDGEVDMPACMGYMIEESENPFGTGAQDCL